ncbi:MAG: putative dehydrogenase [Edaphobacter sp.]|nr:putative dehydrogenase [Edaphobacter sp.]
MLEKLSGETLLYPIIGDPISFVKSPQNMTAEFERRGHNGICVPMKVPDRALEDFVRAVRPVINIGGLLVTMPHKNAMFAHCASSSETSKLLGVVSIAKRNQDGTWHGEMLDGIAFVSAMKQQDAKPEGARILQVGAGGAGSAIAVALLDAGVRELVLHDTNQPRLHELIKLLSELGRGSVVAGPPDPDGCDIIVNATPMGMHAKDPLPVEAHLLAPRCLSPT